MGSGASHSWSTCAPVSESPSVDAFVVEQLADRFGVVVGDVRAKAGREVLVDRELAHQVERAATAFPGEVAHPPALQLGNRADSDTSKVSQRGFIGDSSRSAAASARHSASRYAAGGRRG